MKALRCRQFATSRQPKGGNAVGSRRQREGDDVIDRCSPLGARLDRNIIRHCDELYCGTGRCEPSRLGARMAEELPEFIPRVLQRGDVSLLRADEAVLKDTSSPRPTGAILMIVFAQRAEDIAAITSKQITISADTVTIDLAGTPIDLPPPLDETRSRVDREHPHPPLSSPMSIRALGDPLILINSCESNFDDQSHAGALLGVGDDDDLTHEGVFYCGAEEEVRDVHARGRGKDR